MTEPPAPMLSKSWSADTLQEGVRATGMQACKMEVYEEELKVGVGV